MFSFLPDGYLLDGVIVFDGPAGGYVSAGWWIEAPDLQSANFGQRNQAQDAIAMLLRQLPVGWVMSVQMIHHRGDGPRLLKYQQQTEACQNATSRLVRNANFLSLWEGLEQRQLRCRRVAMYVGHPLGAGIISPWKRKVAEMQYERLLAGARTAFAELEPTINESLRTIGGRAVRLTDTEIFRQWADALNPSFSERILYDPASDYRRDCSLLDNCWNAEVRGQGRQGISVDGWLIQAITFKRLPSETFPTIFHKISHLPFGDFTFTAQIKRLEKAVVLRRTQAALNRINHQLAQKSNERLSVSKIQFEEQVHRLAIGEVVPFEIELIIMVRAKSQEELSAKAAAIKNAIQGMNGAQYYEASLAASTRNLFAKTLPGWMWSRHQGFVFYAEDRTVADLSPFLCATFLGHPGPVQALFRGADNNLVNMVVFLGEGSDATPQNIIFLGAPGTGKSLLLLKLLLELMWLFGFTAIVDEGQSQSPYASSLGVEPIVFRLDGAQTINPFDTQGLPFTSFGRATLTAMVARMVGLPGDEDKARRQSALIAKHVGRLCNDHAEDKLRIWSEERRESVIRHALALHRWAKAHGISDTEAFVDFRDLETDQPEKVASLRAELSEDDLRQFESLEPGKIRDLVFAYLRPEEHLWLSSLREYFEMAEEDEDECRWLATLLTPWCRGGNCGVLFDGVSNVNLTGQVVQFELGLIPEAAKEIKAVAGFMIINGIRQHILSLPKLMKKRIIIEELSRFLDVPGGEAILRELFEQFRKHRTQVIIVSQSYSRIADSSIRTALIGNARAFVIFNTGDRRDIERLAQDIGLSRVAQETILRFPRPDQQTGSKFSECLYWHTTVGQPVCGPLRYVLLPHELSAVSVIQNPNSQNHA